MLGWSRALPSGMGTLEGGYLSLENAKAIATAISTMKANVLNTTLSGFRMSITDSLGWANCSLVRGLAGEFLPAHHCRRKASY